MDIVNQIRTYKGRAWKTACLLSGMLYMGLASGIVGPTLLDLKIQVQEGLNHIAFALTARALGQASGCVTRK